MRFSRIWFCAILMLIWAYAAQAAQVAFELEWSPVIADIQGNSITPDGYRVYTCEQPITSSFNEQISVVNLIGNCDDSMATYEISHFDFVAASSFKGEYPTSSDAGVIHFRVSAYVNAVVNGESKVVESELSNEAIGEYNTIVVFGPITDLRLGQSGVVIIRP